MLNKGKRTYSIVHDFPCKITYIVTPPINKFPVLWDTKHPTWSSQNPYIRPIQCHLKPIHIFALYFYNAHFNIILQHLFVSVKMFSDYSLWSLVILLLLLLLLLLQFSFPSVAVVLTLVQTKQIRINIHKRNNTKTQYQQYKTQ